VTPALWNRWEEAVKSGDLRRHLRRRLSIICESARLDQERGAGLVDRARSADGVVSGQVR
jgi:hypothetical protein